MILRVKKKWLAGALALAVMLPGAAFAANSGTSLGLVAHKAQSKYVYGDRLMEIVKQYSPELTGDFQKVFEERKQIMEQFKAKHEELKEKFKEIHTKVEKGEITKEQAKKEMEKLGFKKGNSESIKKHFELRKQLKDAVANKDTAKVKQILPQLLKQMQERNKQLKEELAKS
jgi:hypothetical protein